MRPDTSLHAVSAVRVAQPGEVFDHPWQAPFIRALAKAGTVATACAVAGISRRQAERCRHDCPTFGAAWSAALQDYADRIEAEVYRRGVEGVDQPLTFRGQPTGRYVSCTTGQECEKSEPGAKWVPYTVKEYSDACLLALAKARVPGFNRTADGDGPAGRDLAALPAEELAVLRQAAQLALARQASLPPPESGQSLDANPPASQG